MKLSTRFFKNKTRDSIHSRKMFHHLFEKERERSLRNGGFFSLLVLNANGGSAKRSAELIYTVQDRIRNIDDMGWFDDEHIGLILPETTYSGADKLAHDIRNRLQSGNEAIEYEIFTYPEQKSSSGPRGGRKGREPDAQHAAPPEWSAIMGKPMPIWKRALDILGASLALIVLAPLFLLIAIYIKIVSPGPVFFRQQRLGYLKQPFVCWKFRTMKVDADGNKHKNHVADLIRNGKQLSKIDDDPDANIIAFGNVLRKLGLDELPQLFNVLRGEMSLIGPRPCLEYEAVEFLDWQNLRFDVHPGLTGLWQVSGKNRTTFEEMMRFDINYGKKRSPFRDMFIFVKTFPAVLDQATENLKNKRKSEYEINN